MVGGRFMYQIISILIQDYLSDMPCRKNTLCSKKQILWTP